MLNFSGNAVRTAISAPITATATTVDIDDPTGWPTENFAVALDRGRSAFEKVLVTSRSLNTLTIQRGYDDTTAQAHDAGASAVHVLTSNMVEWLRDRHLDTLSDVSASAPLDQSGLVWDGLAGLWVPSDLDGRYVQSEPSRAGWVVTFEATAVTTGWHDLATVGPSVTVNVGSSGKLYVAFGCWLKNDTAGQYSGMAIELSGANALAPHFEQSVANQAGNNYYVVLSNSILFTGLAVGSTTVATKYLVTGGNGTFGRRRLAAIPL